MNTTLVEIGCDRITDREAFHDVFAEAFSFPEFCGRNRDAWTDCISSLDTPDEGEVDRKRLVFDKLFEIVQR